MTDDRSLDMTPRAEFADRLEADLLRVIGGHDTYTSTPQLTPDDAEEPPVNVELTPTPPSDRPRWIMFAAAAAVIALVVVGIAFAGRGNTKGDQPAGSHEVTFTVTWSTGEFEFNCAFGTLGCLSHFPMPATSQFDGDIAGRAEEGVFWNERAVYSPDVAQNSSHQEFVAVYGVYGTVPECAINRKSDFMLTETIQAKGSSDSFTAGGPYTYFTTEGPYTGTWQIVPESGRGNLASISGSGTSTGDITYTDKNTWARTFTGTITCP